MDSRTKRLWDLYRLTPDQWQAILEFQQADEDLCLLVGGGRQNVDHRHSDGFVRGILNWQINKGMGLIERACGEHSIGATLRALFKFYGDPPAAAVCGPVYGLIGQAKYKKKMIYGGAE